MSIVQRVHRYLTKERVELREQSEGRSDEGDRVQEPTGRSNLYRCDGCDRTYISEKMDSCSACDTAVEAIPTERDLGLV